MDGQSSDPEKSPLPDKDIEAVPARTVAFPTDDILPSDEKQRPPGVEMRRHMTQEDIRLAAAGYEHLEKDKSGEGHSKFGDVDITEHSLPIHEIEGLLKTSFNWVDPAQSRGLSAADAEARLQRDGPNALTPPKKKSALQKVSIHTRNVLRVSLAECATVHRLFEVHV
jgi:sodium/potassium-transporting ATPase subunit alpha